MAASWWRLPGRWWARQSLRARLTLLATALFSFAVATGAILLLVLQRYALVRVLDASAQKSAVDIARQIEQHPTLTTVQPTTGGISAVQVVNAKDVVIAASTGADRVTPVLDPGQLVKARAGTRFDIPSTTSNARLRVLAEKAGPNTVLVVTDLSRVDDSVRILERAALIGGPIAVLLMALATYGVVALTLRPVAALRHGAADITAAGLADQRLPVPSARDEIHRLAVTLNAMLDRIDTATARQRTFIGDAAHELRSPLASLRVQLEVARLMGPESDWYALVDDVMVDVGRLNRLVEDLLALARTDEAPNAAKQEPVSLDELVTAVAGSYAAARVAVRTRVSPVVLAGDPDGLRRVVINLVDNAVRHAASEVVITTEVTHGDAGGGRTARLAVIDDGAGIEPAERERVFDRFYRIEASRSRDSGGTGLGLPIVRDLVRAHGGSVRLIDRPDGAPGLCAEVLLPLSR